MEEKAERSGYIELKRYFDRACGFDYFLPISAAAISDLVENGSHNIVRIAFTVERDLFYLGAEYSNLILHGNKQFRFYNVVIEADVPLPGPVTRGTRLKLRADRIDIGVSNLASRGG